MQITVSKEFEQEMEYSTMDEMYRYPHARLMGLKQLFLHGTHEELV